MKKMLVALCLIAALPSCKKSDNTGQGSTGSTVNPVVTPTVTPAAERPLSSEDSIAAVNIRTEYAAMRTSLDSMLATPHHTYPVPGHEHDSLVVVTDHHAHDNTDNHFHGHGWHDHHLIDSIHHVYSIYHP